MSVFNSGVSGLLAFQRALATTSNNISNVNTEGYSRQEVVMQERRPTLRDGGYIGAGVNNIGSERMVDQFNAARLVETTSALGKDEAHLAMASRIDHIVSSEGISLTPSMNTFFNAIQDANGAPASHTSRTVLLEASREVATRFNMLQTQLDDAQVDVNARIDQTVSAINDLTVDIADLNREIVGAKNTRNQSPNNLLDQRQVLVNNLAELVGISTVEQSDGSLNVFAGNGVSLVVGTVTQQLRTQPGDGIAGQLDIQYGAGNSWTSIGTRMGGGELGGLREFESTTLTPAVQSLGRLATVFAQELNALHRQGVDLGGLDGEDWFIAPGVAVSTSAYNTGSGTLDIQISDPGSLEVSDYAVEFDGLNYTVTRLADGQQTVSGLPTTIDGLTIDLSGAPAAGDRYQFSATRQAAGEIRVALTDSNKIALGNRIVSLSSIDNISDAKVSSPSVVDVTHPDIDNTVEIRFSDPTTYDIVDPVSGTTLLAAQTYTAGDPIAFNGWEVDITGTPTAADVFRIERNTNGRGDNENGLLLAGLRGNITVGGQHSFNEAYAAMISHVGARTSTMQARTDASQNLQLDAVNRRDEVSGVNLDEEAIKLTRYEQAYQASAKVIQTASTMFDSILAAIS